MKKFKEILKRGLGLLTVMTMVISCMGVLSVSADVDEGNLVNTIDDLWEEFDETKTTFGESTTDKTGAYLNYVGAVSDTGRTDKFITVDYENGTSGNVVLKSGNGSDVNTGVAVYRGMKNLGNIRKQKWEVSVKFASNTDKVDILPYGNNGLLYKYKYDRPTSYDTEGTAIKVESGKVKIYDYSYNNNAGQWIELYSGLEANKWYKFVRFMDFSTDGENMQRVQVYSITADGTEELLADSNNWYKSGKMVWKSSFTLNHVGFNVTQATSGAVMFDDFAAYEMPSVQMSRDTNYVSGANKTDTIDDLWEEFDETKTTFGESTTDKTGAYLNYVGAVSDTGRTDKFITVDYENGTSGNVVLKSGNGSDVNTGVAVYRGMKNLGNIRKQKWEVSVKFASNTDKVDILPYGNNGLLYKYKYDRPTSYDTEGTAIKVESGKVKIYDYSYNNNAGQWIELYSGLEANKWYKFVRFMDFSTDGENMQRVQVYSITADGTEELLADSNNWYKSGKMVWKSSFTLNHVGFNVTSAASGAVMFDDFFVSEVEAFDVNLNCYPVASKTLKIAFSNDMDANTLNRDAITLTIEDIEVELKDVRYDSENNLLTIEFNPFMYSTEYVLTIESDVMSIDFDGMPIYADNPLVLNITTEDDPLSVGGVGFADAEGAAITTNTLNANDVIKGSATLINTTATERPYVVILAIYEGEKMVNVIAKSGMIANTGAEGTVITTESLTVENANSRAEVFVWDSWKTLRPLIEKGVLPNSAL